MNTEQKLRQLEEEQKKLSKEMIIFSAHTEHLSHIRKDLTENKKDVEIIIQRIEEHIADNKINFDKTFAWQNRTDEKFNNHLVHIAADIQDLKWLKKFFWIIMGVSITTVISAFWSIVIK